MSNALAVIECIFTVGQTLYVIEHNRITGQVWNNATPAWETYNAAHWAQYAIPVVEQVGSGYYAAARPSGLAGWLVSDVLYQQASGSPAIGDAPPQALNKSAGENVVAISGDSSVAPTNLQAALFGQTQGAIAAGVITTGKFPTTLTNPNVGAYSSRVIYMLTGAAAGMAGLIAQYNPVSGVITLSGGLAIAPAAADLFTIA